MNFINRIKRLVRTRKKYALTDDEVAEFIMRVEDESPGMSHYDLINHPQNKMKETI